MINLKGYYLAKVLKPLLIKNTGMVNVCLTSNIIFYEKNIVY